MKLFYDDVVMQLTFGMKNLLKQPFITELIGGP